MTFRTTEEIHRFAISQEEQARDFYLALADRVSSPQVRKAMLEFAEEEAGHKRKLEEVVAGRMDALPTEAPEDLRLSDPMPELLATAGMESQSIAHILIIILIVLGNIGDVLLRRRARLVSGGGETS